MTQASEQVKERPVVLYPHEVRNALEKGQGQFRRVVTPQPQEAGGYSGHERDIKWDVEPGIGVCTDEECAKYIMAKRRCPYGKPGDRLWVREGFATGRHDHFWIDAENDKHDGDKRRGVLFRATHKGGLKPICEGFTVWKSPIHMPRWASRITLEVVDVRVERVQDISKDDAIAEGIHGHWDDIGGPRAVTVFRELWDSINTSRGYGWATNPWVWAVQFKVIDNGKATL